MSKTFVFKDLKVVNLDKKTYVNFIDILWLLYIFMVQAKTKKELYPCENTWTGLWSPGA